MNASVAIQVLPKVATSEETIRVVDEVIAFIKSFDVGDKTIYCSGNKNLFNIDFSSTFFISVFNFEIIHLSITLSDLKFAYSNGLNLSIFAYKILSAPYLFLHIFLLYL